MKTDLEIQQDFEEAGKSIVLIGFMASGKTAIGNALGGILGKELVDSDKAISQKERMSVGEIFEKKGQPYFRSQERDFIAKALQAKKPIILSTGGGAFMDAQTRKLILDNSVPVWLQASAETIFKRSQADLKADPKAGLRPLIHIKTIDGKERRTSVAERRERISHILEERQPIYEVCPVHIDTENNTPEQIAYTIVKTLGFVPNSP